MIKNISLFSKAVSLRKEGKSYLEISTLLHVPKSTLCSWFHTLHWSQGIRNDLVEKNRCVNTQRIIRLNKARRSTTLARHDDYRREAQREYISMKKDPLFLIGISLYWGEGEKTNSGRVSVINSDDKMLKVIVSFYRNVLHISNEKLRAALFLYKDLNEQEMLQYWSEVIQLPISQFIKTQILRSRSVLTKRKVNNGMCTVYFSDTKLTIKIREWIRLLSQDVRV